MSSTILIKNGFVVDVINKENSKVKDIYIKDNKIIKVSENISEKADKVIDATNNIIMPGLINTHGHSAMTLFRGYADDLELNEWLNNKIWPVEDKLTAENIYDGSLLACVEMIKSGTTTFNDMYYFTESTLKAVEQTGIRAMLGRCIMSIEDEKDVRVCKAINLIEKFSNTNERITFNIAVHAPHTCNEKSLKLCINLAKKYNVPIHIHLAETISEYNLIKEKYNLTPTQFLNKMGIFDVPVILAHCVWVDDEDIEILRNIKGGISHNPISNCKLASGIAPITKYLKNNINISLGTDGAGSTNTLDIFEEMKVCNLLQKVNLLDSTAIDAYTTIQMVTIGGARTLGLEEKIGSIEENKIADIIILDTKSANLNPLNDVFSNLVYVTTGANVLTTIINGQIVMENRYIKTIDENEVISKCNKISHALLR